MITKDELTNIIVNSKIAFSEEEIAGFQEKINAAIEMVSIIGELDLTAVEPMFYPNEQEYNFRDANMELQTNRESLLANTQTATTEYFKFPAVLKEGENDV
jgi:aspartyl/glutamyl-tRNA(Asn/Gln) amidotransferase, C subunit